MRTGSKDISRTHPLNTPTPRYILYHLFPVDSVLIDNEVTEVTIDRTRLCLPDDPQVCRRMLHLFRPLPPEEIVADALEMGATGIACVGLDGTMLSPDEIRSPRYTALIRACQQAGLEFIHGFPFADTYDNALTRTFPHISQRDFTGKSPYVGWHAQNGHPNIDYGSDEFIAYCRQCIDALCAHGVREIDYAEPDHYPYPDNGYGESLTQAWHAESGSKAPHPTTIEYRHFMEERNLRGMREIGAYAKQRGMTDHLTASPLMHNSALICQNYGKYAHTDIDELSTTYHTHYSPIVQHIMREALDIHLSLAQADGIGCIESKSMRGWGERHAVYFGCGQSHPLDRVQSFLHCAVLLHQMDLFCWDYGNFRFESMYAGQRFEDPQEKFRQIKALFHRTVEMYRQLPEVYRLSIPDPDALVLYAKDSDYQKIISEPSPTQVSGGQSLYGIASKLQTSGIPFMFAYDSDPQVLENNGQETPLLIIDGCQHTSKDFAAGVARWFGPGKIVLVGGELRGETPALIAQLAETVPPAPEIEPITQCEPRVDNVQTAPPYANAAGWKPLLYWHTHPVVFVKGSAESGLLLASTVPLCRLYQCDLGLLCRKALSLVGRPGLEISGDIAYEVVRYRGRDRQFFAIFNQTASRGILRVSGLPQISAVFPEMEQCAIEQKTDTTFCFEGAFQPHEVRIIETALPIR